MVVYFLKFIKKRFFTNFFVFLLTMIPLNKIMSQDNLKTEFYNITFPKTLMYEKINSTKEELGNTSVYKIINSEQQQVKYLMYLMSNKSNIETVIESKLDQYVEDLGNVKVLDKEKLVFKNTNAYRLKVSLKKNITGILYLLNIEDVLYRVLFMIPQKHYLKNEKEINNLFLSTSFLKKSWKNEARK